MKLAMIGAGRMGGTIVRMLQKEGLWSLEVCEPDSKGRAALSKEMGAGVKFVEKVEEVGEAEAILLAVKPAMLKDVAGWLQSRKGSYLLISGGGRGDGVVWGTWGEERGSGDCAENFYGGWVCVGD